MNRIAVNLLAIGMAGLLGAAGMKYWDYSVQQFQLKLVEKELAQQRLQPAVDVHQLGLHGAWVDPGKDGEEPVRTASDKAAIETRNAEARKLFTTPGGAYTLADIQKNGALPPFERFHRYQYQFAMRPFPGEPMDPITLTKASPAFSWFIGGKQYHFASIASLEQFVAVAKEEPSRIKPPEAYITPKA